MRIGIVGAGIVGRTLCCHLLNNSYEVRLFDKNSLTVTKNCSFAAAGLLSAYAETQSCLPPLAEIGVAAIDYWKKFTKNQAPNVFFDDSGTICLADNQIELQNFKKILMTKFSNEVFKEIMVANYESEITGHYRSGIYLADEAQIDAQKLMIALVNIIQQRNVFNKVKISFEEIKDLPHKIGCDWLVDCRGLSAKREFTQLRGVRGELLFVEAPNVQLKHVIRYFHPRYDIYILPRANNIYLIGASCIESEDYSAITVKTILELLSTAYSIHRGFGEAKLIATKTNCRPAFNENLPRLYVDYERKIITVNGCYRYGFLFAPVFSMAIENFLQTSRWQKTVLPYLVH